MIPFEGNISPSPMPTTPRRPSPSIARLTDPNTEIKSEADLLPPGAAPGTVPTDLEQATGLERFEILGKMQGIDVFDMKPLDASRRGTLRSPTGVGSQVGIMPSRGGGGYS